MLGYSLAPNLIVLISSKPDYDEGLFALCLYRSIRNDEEKFNNWFVHNVFVGNS